MSETPPAGHPSAPGPAGYPFGPPPSGPWGPPPPVAFSKPARWPTFVMVLITLVAVGAAVAAWLRPIPHNTSAPPPAPTYSEQQVSDAKATVCAAFDKSQKASRDNLSRSGGDDPNTQLLVAVNMRQVFVASSAYLLTTLADEPATPADLTALVRKLANLLQVITLDGLSGDPNDAGHDAVNVAAKAIEGLCK
jgi:hypothetical protein